MTKKKFLLRYLIFMTGLFFTGVGIALTTKTGLGSTPISILPLVLTRVVPLTFGQLVIILSVIFVLIQILILGKKFSKEQYIQFIICPFFGYFIDFGVLIFRDVSPVHYLEKLLTLFVACLILALGIYLQVLAQVIINPGEGVVRAIAQKTKYKFGNMKILFDFGVMMIGILLSLALFHSILGVREGTLILSFAIGTLTKGFKVVFDPLFIPWLYE